MLCGKFKYIMHKHINQMANASIAVDQTIYLFVNTTSPKTGALMSDVYDQHKADDGVLYITYSAENTCSHTEPFDSRRKFSGSRRCLFLIKSSFMLSACSNVMVSHAGRLVHVQSGPNWGSKFAQ